MVSALVMDTIDFGAPVIAADVAGGNELVADEVLSSGFGSAYTSSATANSGISAGDALASLAVLMVPTVMVLSREPEILEVLGDLYNSMTDPEAQEE